MLDEISEELKIILTGEAASEEMAAYLPRLECVLQDSAEENQYLVYMRA